MAELPAQAQVAAWARLPRQLTSRLGRFRAAGPAFGTRWAAGSTASGKKKERAEASWAESERLLVWAK
jgi:hypothetical protein